MKHQPETGGTSTVPRPPSLKTPEVVSAAAALFDRLEWPSTADDAWRRTDLARLLPKGALDRAAGTTAGGSVDPGGSQKDPRPALSTVTGSGTGEVSPATASASAVLRGKAVTLSGLPVPMLPEGWAARVITEGGVPVAAATAAGTAESGLVIEWVSAVALPAGIDTEGRLELDRAADRMTAWHWRDLPGSVLIRVPRGLQVKGPLVIEERLVRTGSATPHVHVDVATSASVTVIWSFEGAPSESEEGFTAVNAGLSGCAADDARLDLTIRQNLGAAANLFLHTRLTAGRDSRLIVRESHLGGNLVKSRTRVILNGEGSDARLKGLYVARSGRHVDISTIQEHRAARATSDALYKGAVQSGGRSVFQGLIEVAPHAPKTDAYLTNNNLVLGDGARADSLPQLNILTDDVKCSHGSTTGRLNPAQIFYLESRGFPPAEARRELTRGFLAQVLDQAPDAVSGILAQDLDSALDFA